MSALEQKIADIVSPVIEGEGFALVKVRTSDGLVEIMAEDPATRNLKVDDAAKLSRAISAHLDVEDPVTGAYRLEVSSPGIDRPLVTFADYEAYIGHDAKLERKIPDDTGQKRFRGILDRADNNVISIETDQGIKNIPFEDIAKGKLVLTDRLIKEMSEKFKNQNS